MKIEIIGKNIEVTEAMRNLTEEKLQNLSKYVILGKETPVRVLARTYKAGQKIEVTIWSDIGILRSEVLTDDYYKALDLAVDKLKGQIRRQKTRIKDKHREHAGKALLAEQDAEEQKSSVPLRTKVIRMETMSVDEAIYQMDLLGHTFFAYMDEESGKPAIVYVRKDDSYGCLDLE